MRIVQVVHGLPPHERAGTEILTLELSRALQARGHQVTIIARTSALEREEFSLQEERDEHGPQIIRIVNNYTRITSFRLHYDNPFFHDVFRRLLHRCQADIVHFQHVTHLSASLIPSVASLGYPTVLSLHDLFFACHLVHLIDRADRLCPGPQQGERCVTCLHDITSAEGARHRFAYMTQVLQVPQRVITPSVFLARRIADEFPFLRDRLQAIAPGLPLPPGAQERPVPPETFGEVPDSSVPSRTPRRPLRIMYVGVLMPHKGAHVLIDALKGLPADRVHASFYGAGLASKQAYINQLRQAATGLSVHWGGVYDRSNLQTLLAEHDVLVMPVIWEETFSLVTREALHAGLPVIAARRGALPEAVEDGRNGLLFEPENAEDLRRCLRRLIDEPELLDQLKSERFTWRDADAYARDVEQTYEAVLGQVGSRPAIPQGTGGPKDPEVSGPAALPRLLRDTSPEAARPRLSVCLPTYNGEAYIAEAVRSVLQQSYSPFEIVVVDDGSNDRTLEILQSFTDPRIRIYQNPRRRGIPGNWNEAVALARGEYACVFHQDDVMLAGNLARKMTLFDSDPSLSLVYSEAEPIIESDAPNRLGDERPGDERGEAETDFVREGEECFRQLLLRGNSICAPTVIVRREQLAGVGGFNEALGYTCDYEMWMKLCVEGRIGFIHDTLVRYRWHAGNASHAYQDERGRDDKRGLGECERAMRGAVAYYAQSRGEMRYAQLLAEAAEATLEQRTWVAELDRGRDWLEEQWQRWQELAEERERALQEQQAWISELEKGKTWLEEQQTNHERVVQEQRTWIGELEKGKTWLEEQRHNWEHIARQREEQVEHWQAQAEHWRTSLWGRLGLLLKLVNPAQELPTKESKSDD